MTQNNVHPSARRVPGLRFRMGGSLGHLIPRPTVARPRPFIPTIIITPAQIIVPASVPLSSVVIPAGMASVPVTIAPVVPPIVSAPVAPTVPAVVAPVPGPSTGSVG